MRWASSPTACRRPAYPESLCKYADAKYTKIGSMKEPDFEAISAGAPDLIIISGRTAGAYAELSKIAPTIDLSVDAARADGVLQGPDRERWARSSARQPRSTEARGHRRQIADTKAKAADAGKGLIVLTSGGEVTAYGAGSRFGLIHDVLGVPTAADVKSEGAHGEAVSFEFIKETNPDLLYVIDRDAAIGTEAAASNAVLDNELVAVHQRRQERQDRQPGPRRLVPRRLRPEQHPGHDRRGRRRPLGLSTSRTPHTAAPPPNDGRRGLLAPATRQPRPAANREALAAGRRRRPGPRRRQHVRRRHRRLAPGPARRRPAAWDIFWISRVPRTLAVVLAGIAVAVAGLIMQLMARNRFVEPSTVGTVGIGHAGHPGGHRRAPAAPLLAKMGVASVFALLGTALFLAVLRRLPARNTLLVPLVGIMLGGVIAAVTTFFAYRYDLLQTLNNWMIGDFSGVLRGRYELLWIVAVADAWSGYVAADRFTVAGHGRRTSPPTWA